jgi:hypothetical protein
MRERERERVTYKQRRPIPPNRKEKFQRDVRRCHHKIKYFKSLTFSKMQRYRSYSFIANSSFTLSIKSNINLSKQEGKSSKRCPKMLSEFTIK